LIPICPLINRYSAGGGHAVAGSSRNRFRRSPAFSFNLSAKDKKQIDDEEDAKEIAED
jgi:hypothetical protein